MPVAAIDAGTTGVRCMIIGKKGEVLSLARRSWDYETLESLEIAKAFDPSHFWELICSVTTEALNASGLADSKIEGVAATSQRHGVVFLDADGNELHGGPNIDARGAMSQYVIEEAVDAGFDQIILVTRESKRSIEAHFEPHAELAVVMNEAAFEPQHGTTLGE